MANKAYAEIIVDVATRKLDRIFHYRVPDGMSGQLSEGMRVIVPFGRRTLEGYIVGFTENLTFPMSKTLLI